MFCAADLLDIVGIGLQDIVAVAMPDAVLVAHRDNAQHVKIAIDTLKKNRVEQATRLPREYRLRGGTKTSLWRGGSKLSQLV